MAFQRPHHLQSLLQSLEELPGARNILISIDGARDLQDEVRERQKSVLRIAESYARNSQHSITVMSREDNLGLTKHFLTALSQFFNSNEFGIVLEDDLRVDLRFIKMIDHVALDYERYWSICAYSPLANSRSRIIQRKAFFFETHVHTIWGWAAHRNSISSFLESSNLIQRYDDNEIKKVLERAVRLMGISSKSRYRFESTWMTKMRRFRTSERPNWDNLWVFAGWMSGKPSVMFSHSLAFEDYSPSALQTHQGPRSESNSTFPRKSLKIQLAKVRRLSPKREECLVQVWGVRKSFSSENLKIKLLSLVKSW